MRALVCNELGDPSVLKVEQRRIPHPRANEVLIQVGAAAVNFPDLLMVAGGYQHKPALPFIPGMEGAGRIIGVGKNVEGWRKDDRVIFGVRPGAFAEYVRVPAHGELGGQLMELPAPWTWSEGAGFRVAAQTAYHSLVHRAALKSGEVALIHGAAGGVGLAAVQLAKHLGATVIATAGDDGRLEVVKDYGADHVINYRTGDFVPAVKALTGGRGADVIYDPVGGEVLEKSLRAAAYGARLLIVGFTSGGPTQLASNHVLIKALSVIGIRAGETALHVPEFRKDYDEVLPKLAALDVMKPHISHRFPLERAAEAFRALADRKVIGKAVIEMDA
ncbi:MAG: NADPH:quinone oxidoreductase family protein [Alphaproteobacteria bacterium]|nr:NADPH:quinone oxidoreductase family protein [Alphaproteobacteria bacterium]